jgi:hypothetical protein
LVAGVPAAAGLAVGGLAKQSGWIGASLWSKIVVGVAAAAIGATAVRGAFALRAPSVISRAAVTAPVAAMGRAVLPELPEPPQPAPAQVAEATEPTARVRHRSEHVHAPAEHIASSREDAPVPARSDVPLATPPVPPQIPRPLPRAAAQPATAAPADPKAPVPGPTVTEELAILDRALARTEASRWSDALDELGVYDARFPAGALRVEAGGLKVLALCGLGRTDDAVALARMLRATSPSSPAVRRLQHSCAAE